MKTVLMILAALPLLATDGGNVNFGGRVYKPDGTNLIPDAIVTVSTPAGFVSSVTTSKSGEFSFSSLPAGQYDFRVTAHGFAIYERQITVSNEGGMKELIIRMLVPADKQTVSIAELRNPDITHSGGAYRSSLQRGY